MNATEQDIRQALVALLPRLKRFAYGLTGSHDDADDLVQATCARALARLEQWQAGTRLDSWLFRIAHSIRINQWRANRVRGTEYEPIDPDTQIGSDGSAVEAQITLEAVRQFIWRLPEEQRVVLMLIAVEGLSYKEAADALELPMGTVTSRLARARIAINEYVHHTDHNRKSLQQSR